MLLLVDESKDIIAIAVVVKWIYFGIVKDMLLGRFRWKKLNLLLR